MPAEGKTTARYIRLPLHVLAAAGTTMLLLLVSATVAWTSYRNTREVISSAVDESARHVAMILRGHIAGILQPAENQLDVLVYNELARAGNIEQRMQALPMAATVLASSPVIDTVYAAWPDGAFMLFRALRDASLRQVYQAPAGSTLMVQSVHVEPDGTRLGQYFYFDRNNRLLHQELKPTYVFDPRQRPWYRLADGAHGTVLTEPYVFYTNRQIGITLARKAPGGEAIFGLDATLQGIGAEIATLRLTPGTHVAVVDSGGQLLASDLGEEVLQRYDESGVLRLAWLEDLHMPVLEEAFRLPAAAIARHSITFEGGDWELISAPLPLQSSNAYRVLLAVPDAELFGHARTLLHRQWILILVLILLSVPAGYWLTQRIVRPLRQLVEETRRVASFDFTPSSLKRSRVAEVDMLTTATVQMRSTIARFLDVSAALNSELHLDRLLEVVLDDMIITTAAKSGAIYLCHDDSGRLVRSQTHDDVGKALPHYPAELDLQQDAAHPAMQVVRERRSIAASIGADGPALFAVPLETLGKEFVGVLVLEMGEQLTPEHVARRDPVVAFIEALSSTAAVAIETRRLVDAQRALLNAIIHLLAGAIDAKSPYTGGHCQRVPELTLMLAEAAHQDDSAALRDFHLTPALRESVHIGAWLHDCGKITTPEHIVDKATKLETIRNRIHEVRLRFEVLKRDAEISFWKQQAGGAADAVAQAGLRAVWRELDEEFAFVATCNLGGEDMDDTTIARLQRIGQRRWARTLDDRLGLSSDELRRFQGRPAPTLPVEEPLLADKPEDIEIRPPQELIPADNPWGFRMEVPARKFNRGELYNLSVRRGTLTTEDRYIINEHIVQTIMMLNALPFPRHLRDVPEIAGGHHEKMDGTGYPKRLRGDQMSVPARIMAVADVFEALTAADRPYKSAKPLSASLAIMARMAREQHLDRDLFALFVRSGVYLDYARRYLQPAQIDAVDEAALLRASLAS